MEKSTIPWRLILLVVAIVVQVDGEGEVRLMGGSTSLEGRVEVYHNGYWGTICDDYWDLADADVVCRQLGFASAQEAKEKAFFGQGSSSMTIWLDNVDCTGNEDELSDCNHNGWGWEGCGHWEDAGVVCSNSGASEGDLRLVDGYDIEEGRVEIYHYGEWGTICDDYWGSSEARVVCRQLGYNGVSNSETNKYGAGQGPIHLDNVFCTGSESKLIFCSNNGWGVQDCSHSDDVGVKCYKSYSSGLEGWAISLIVISSFILVGLVVAIGVRCSKPRRKRTSHADTTTAAATSHSTAVASTTQNAVPMQPYPVQQPNVAGVAYPAMAGAAYPPTAGSAYPPTTGSAYPPPAGAAYPPTAGAPYPPAGAAFQAYQPPPQYEAKSGMPPSQ